MGPFLTPLSDVVDLTSRVGQQSSGAPKVGSHKNLCCLCQTEWGCPDLGLLSMLLERTTESSSHACHQQKAKTHRKTHRFLLGLELFLLTCWPVPLLLQTLTLITGMLCHWSVSCCCCWFALKMNKPPVQHHWALCVDRQSALCHQNVCRRKTLPRAECKFSVLRDQNGIRLLILMTWSTAVNIGKPLLQSGSTDISTSHPSRALNACSPECVWESAQHIRNMCAPTLEKCPEVVSEHTDTTSIIHHH